MDKTEIGRCKDCKYWGGEPEYCAAADDYREEGFGVLKRCCSASRDFDNWIFCDYDTIQSHAAYLCGPEFGCVDWEKKDGC